MEHGFHAKIVADSINQYGYRITSVECRYWRAIHSELMTHRAFARNAASSRAIPFYRFGHTITGDSGPVPNCTYAMIDNDPFFPLFIGAEQKGMQSGEELEHGKKIQAHGIIADMKTYCLQKCFELYKLGVHKSIINRYLEPWSYITVIITATEWNNFFRLRVHPAAEKHFNLLATLIKDSMSNSSPAELKTGEWHLPYTTDIERKIDFIDDMASLKKISAARCARVSYLTHDGKRDYNSDLDLFAKLIERNDDVLHASPLEHVAQAAEASFSGPFRGWKQFRKEYENENITGSLPTYHNWS